MNSRRKTFLVIFILILLINLLIFFNREKGFEYIKYASKRELYPDKTNKKFLYKWSEENTQYSSEELNQGLTILKTDVGFDTILASQDKITRIAAWIYSTFYEQRGRYSDTLRRLRALQQYRYLISHKDKKLWCGQFQNIFGFFCTSAGLVNRYIEVVPSNSGVGDYHEINEVYLPDQNKWAMVDVTRNIALLKSDGQVLSAADYFDYNLTHPTNSLLITRSTGSLLTADSLYEGSVWTDRYFNSNYKLRFYRIMYASNVYNPITKFKRYIISDPWYEMYDPVHSHSNFLFRIKQFFFFALVVSAFLFTVEAFKRWKKMTQFFASKT